MITLVIPTVNLYSQRAWMTTLFSSCECVFLTEMVLSIGKRQPIFFSISFECHLSLLLLSIYTYMSVDVRTSSLMPCSRWWAEDSMNCTLLSYLTSMSPRQTDSRAKKEKSGEIWDDRMRAKQTDKHSSEKRSQVAIHCVRHSTRRWTSLSEDYSLVNLFSQHPSTCLASSPLLGVISTFAVHPIDTLKVTMQSHSTHSIFKATKLIVQLNSVRTSRQIASFAVIKHVFSLDQRLLPRCSTSSTRAMCLANDLLRLLWRLSSLVRIRPRWPSSCFAVPQLHCRLIWWLHAIISVKYTGTAEDSSTNN